MLVEARLAWGSLRERKGRTIGAIVGVFIAFVALTEALALGNAFRSSALNLFEGLGVNNVFVRGSFTDADVALVKTYVAPYATAVVPISSAIASVRLPNGVVEGVTLYGIPSDGIGVIVPESAVYDGSNNVGGGLALVGYFVAFDENTGTQLLNVGNPLPLNYRGRSYTLAISGILSAQYLGPIDTTTSVVLDESQFRAITGDSTYQLIVVSLKSTQYLDEVQNLLKAVYPNAEVLNLQSLVQTVTQFFTGLELFLGIVSGVSTVITALWLYDTMTISVLQRTKEFGILRAVGFKKRQITAVMLYEALIIAAIGIAAGVVALILLSFIPISFFPQTAAPRGAFSRAFRASPSLSVPWNIGLETAALVVAVNMLGALAPAIRAGRLNIVDALRYE
ncbi:MAG: ABC transporter permease [Thermoproteus sp.]